MANMSDFLTSIHERADASGLDLSVEYDVDRRRISVWDDTFQRCCIICFCGILCHADSDDVENDLPPEKHFRADICKECTAHFE